MGRGMLVSRSQGKTLRYLQIWKEDLFFLNGWNVFLAHGIAFFDQIYIYIYIIYIRPNLRKPCLCGVIVLQNCNIASVQQQHSRLNLQRWQWFQQTLRPLTPVDFRYFKSATWSKKMRVFSDHFVTNTVEEILHQLLDYVSSYNPNIYSVS